MNIRAFQPSDEEHVLALWERCQLTRPWNNPRLDIARKLTVQPDLFLVGEELGKVVASLMAGFDGHRGWVNYLAVDPQAQGKGFARELMCAVEAKLIERGCPKLNLQIRDTNQHARGFYEAIGYVQDPVLSYGKRLIPD